MSLRKNNIFSKIKTIDVADMAKGEKHPKLTQGDPGELGDTTYKMTHTLSKRRYFLRDRPYSRYLIDAVVSSKIARMISKQHFASEKWLSDGRIVSEAVVDSAIPHPEIARYAAMRCYDNHNPEKLKALREQYVLYNSWRNSHDIKGLGVIDEVCAFIGESDPNYENLMFSNALFDNSTTAIKIDFDRCSLELPPRFYKDTNAIYGRQVYRNFPVEYAKERAHVRLKLSLMSDDLIAALLDKYCPENVNEFTSHLIVNRDLALQNLNSEQYGLAKLLSNNASLKEIMRTLTDELISYCKKHFPDQVIALEASLNARLAFVESYAVNELHVPVTKSASSITKNDTSPLTSTNQPHSATQYVEKTTADTVNEHYQDEKDAPSSSTPQHSLNFKV